jgi:O-antigen/teichoic acid export membrane protein
MSEGHGKTIVRAAGISFIGSIISKFLTLLYRVLIARYFGPEAYGLFSLVKAVIGSAATFGEMGLRTGIQRYISYYRSKGDQERTKGTIFYSLLISGSISVIVIGILLGFSSFISNSLFNNSSMRDFLIVMSLGLPFYVMFQIVSAGLLGFKAIRYQVYTEKIFWNLMSLITIIFFTSIGIGIIGIAWSYTISIGLTLLLAVYYFQTRIFPFLKSDIKAVNVSRELLSFSTPLLFHGLISGLFISNVNILLIGYFLDSASVGVYDAAFPIARILGLFPSSLAVIFFPMITGFYAEGRIDKVKNVSEKIVDWTFFSTLPLLIPIIFYPDIILSIIFGAEYSSGAFSLVVLSLGVFIRIFTSRHMYLLGMVEKTRVIFSVTVFTGIGNVFINWILIPILGINGAALSFFSTIFVQFILIFYFSYRYTKIIPYSYKLIKVTGISIITFFIIATLGSTLLNNMVYNKLVFVSLMIGYFGLYSVGLLVSKVLDKEDIEILMVIEKRSGIKSDYLRNIIKKFI